MNNSINIAKILKNCPRGTKFYSTVHGEIFFKEIINYTLYPLSFITPIGVERFTATGKLFYDEGTECILFPSKDQRDWSKFTAPWYKKEKFDPKTLKPFDKIIARVEGGIWFCELLSFIEEGRNLIKGFVSYYNYCIPYNDETKHLVGTTDEAPEYYRYWED